MSGGGELCIVPGCSGPAYIFGVCLDHRLEETAPSARELDLAIDAIRREERMHEEAAAKLAAAQIRENPPPAGGSRYGEVALARTCEEIAGLAEGSRNMELSRAAYRIGGLVGSGHVGEREATDALARAGEACGLPRQEAESVVKRGVRAGAAKPWAPRSNRSNNAAGFQTASAWGNQW